MTGPGHDADVIIVGYGPVGQVPANLLGARGHKVAVFEVATSVYNLPRAAGLDAEIMRIFQSLGLAEQVLPCTKLLSAYEFVTGDGEVLFSFQPAAHRGLNGWAQTYLFYQPELEAALQEGVRRYPNVAVHPGHEVIALRQDDDGVEADVRQLPDGEPFTVRARYLIGCDGARSITRKTAGIALEDLEFDQPWLVVDTMLKRDVNLPEAAQQICEPTRPVTFIPSRGNHRRWEFMLMPGDEPESFAEIDNVWRLLSPWVTPDDTEVVRHVVYTFHGLIAERWRDRRMFLAGDAAHQMPPFLGQGMCSGIRDAANLAWKLDLLLRGLADETLLDTYQVERSPHVRGITQRAMQLGNFIQTTDPEVAARRNAMFLNAGSDHPGDKPAAGADDELRMAIPGLSGGLLTDSDSRCGRLFPQGLSRAADGTRALLDEFIGLRFAVVTDAVTALTLSQSCLTPEIVDLVTSLNVALIALGDGAVPDAPPGFTGIADESGIVLKWLGEGNAAVVRPDRYTYGIAEDSAGLSALLLALKRELAGAPRPAATA